MTIPPSATLTDPPTSPRASRRRPRVGRALRALAALAALASLGVLVLASAGCDPDVGWSFDGSGGAGYDSGVAVRDGGGSGADTLVAPKTDSTTTPGTCADVASQNGWRAYQCDNGDGACNGQGSATSDCGRCCAAPACADIAAANNWNNAQCDNAPSGGGPCDGKGTPSRDCALCCDKPSPPKPSTAGFGFPAGDKTTPPAGGGWSVWQVMSHYLSGYGGRHLAQDIGKTAGGVATINAPIYAVADGKVLYAKPNSSSYKYVLLIEHDMGDGTKVCSFFGHINPPLVKAGDTVKRGDKIATVRDWAKCVSGGRSSNTHLHYVILASDLCARVAKTGATSGASGVCGYDKGGSGNGVGHSDLSTEPFSYTAVRDACGTSGYSGGYISPSKFIEKHLYTKNP